MAHSTLDLVASVTATLPRYNGTDEALSLAARLHAEFDAPVAIYEASEEVWSARVGQGAELFPEPVNLPFGPREVQVGRGEVAGRLRLWLGLPLPRSGDGAWVAVVAFDVPEAPAVWTERALLAWGRSVAERFTAEAAHRDGVGPTAVFGLIDRLIRRLRVSDRPERFQKRATASVCEAMDVQAVAWVPANPREPTVLAGEVPGLPVEVFHELASESAGDRVRVCQQPSRSVPKEILSFAVASADTDIQSGCLIAVNPRGGRPFAEEVQILRTVASLLGTQRANARLYGDLKELLFGVIRALTAAIDAKDPYTSGHSERVARIAVRLGQELGMSAYQQSDLYLMGLLHDVGKIGVEDGVLKKPGKLTPSEYEQIQAHVKIGVHILSDLKKLHHLLPGVAHHHESFDGTGYPSGLRGDAIPISARILAVADAFDAMSSSRPYRRRMTAAQIDDVFRNGVRSQWDSGVVDALFACRADLDHIRQKGLGESLHQVISETLGRS